MNIDVVDATSNDLAMRLDRQDHPGALRVTTVGNMVIQIMRRLGSQQLHRLRIFGHGMPGVQGLGNSVQGTTGGCILVGPDGRLMDREILVLLRRSFAPGARVELHGCQVGSGQSGKALLTELALLWQVEVRAGTANQHRDPGFEGRPVIANPTAPHGVQFRR